MVKSLDLDGPTCWSALVRSLPDAPVREPAGYNFSNTLQAELMLNCGNAGMRWGQNITDRDVELHVTDSLNGVQRQKGLKNFMFVALSLIHISEPTRPY